MWNFSGELPNVIFVDKKKGTNVPGPGEARIYHLY